MLNQIAAEWGLFNANFAWLADRLAAAVFYLRRRDDPNLCFEAIIQRPFGQNLTEFENKLGGFDDLDYPDVQDGLAACKEMRRSRPGGMSESTPGSNSISRLGQSSYSPGKRDKCYR